MAKVHYLKTWNPYYQEVKNGNKTFEIRKNDREYEVGDTLILQEYDHVNEKYTGDWYLKIVSYILDEQPFVHEGYVCMGIKDITFNN